MGHARAPWQHLAAFFLALAPLAALAGAPAMLVADSIMGPLQRPQGKPHTTLKVDASMRKQIWGDHEGSLYYSLHSQHIIIRIDGQSGNPTIVAGTPGKPGHSGDGTPAKQAQLRQPGAMWGTRDELFLLDGNDTLLRKIDEHGDISTVRAFSWTRPSISGIWGDTSGNIWLTERTRNQILRLKADGTGDVVAVAGDGRVGDKGDGGPALLASLHLPNGLWGDAYGNIFFAEMGNNRIRKISTDNIITTVAGSLNGGFSGDGGKAVAAKLDCPCDVWGDGYGSLYIADMHNNRVRKVDAAGTISTYAGSGKRGFSGDGGSAVQAELHAPKGVWVDRNGQVYISDTFNHIIRKVDHHGSISSFGHVGVPGSRSEPFSKQLQLGYTAALGHLIADASHHTVVQVLKDASTSHFADTKNANNRGVVLKHPQSICASEQSVFVVDSGSKVVHEVSQTGTRQLAAGKLQNPAGCAASRDWLFVADSGNHAIKGIKLDTGQTVHIAGGKAANGCSDGQLRCPYGIVLLKNASALVTDPCCPKAFLRHVGLRDGTIKRVASREHEKGTAQDMATVAVAGGSIWVAGINDCGLHVVDTLSNQSYAVDLMRINGHPSELDCVLAIVSPPDPPPRLHLLGRNRAGEVKLVFARVPSLQLLAPASGSRWRRGEQLVVRWAAKRIWGLLEVRLVASKGSTVLTLGETDAAKETLSVSRADLLVADGTYVLEVRSKRWPLVRCFGGPVLVGETGDSTTGPTKTVQAHSWLSGARWALVGSGVVAGLVLVPLCFLRVNLKDYGRLGGAIHYRPREIFGGGPGVAGGREMDAIVEQSPVCLGRSGEGGENQ